MRASLPSLEWTLFPVRYIWRFPCWELLLLIDIAILLNIGIRYAEILTPTFSPKFGTTRYIPGWRVVPGSQRPARSIGCEWVKKNLKDSDNGRKRVHRQPPRRKTSSQRRLGCTPRSKIQHKHPILGL